VLNWNWAVAQGVCSGPPGEIRLVRCQVGCQLRYGGRLGLPGWTRSGSTSNRTRHPRRRDRFIVGRTRATRRLVQKAPGAHRRKVAPSAVIGGLRRCVRARAANVHAARSGWQRWLSRCAGLIACVAKRRPTEPRFNRPKLPGMAGGPMEESAPWTAQRRRRYAPSRLASTVSIRRLPRPSGARDPQGADRHRTLFRCRQRSCQALL
jgi:hypothetical protein